MLKILFDFEIDEQLPLLYSPKQYEIIRDFFVQHFGPFELEMMIYIQPGDYAVIIILVSEHLIKPVSFNIPDHLMTKMNRCITRQHIETLQEVLSSVEENK